MTDAPETDASFLAPVSGACVRGITSLFSTNMAISETSVYRQKLWLVLGLGLGLVTVVQICRRTVAVWMIWDGRSA